jgi:hypothetical protein
LSSRRKPRACPACPGVAVGAESKGICNSLPILKPARKKETYLSFLAYLAYLAFLAYFAFLTFLLFYFGFWFAYHQGFR